MSNDIIMSTNKKADRHTSKPDRHQSNKKGIYIIAYRWIGEKNMLRTNSKKAMENIRKEIVDSYEAAEEYFTFEGREQKKEFPEICRDILKAFNLEKLEGNKIYMSGRVSRSEMFADWMAGLPTAFPVADDIFLRSAVNFLGEILEETEEEKGKYTEEKAEKLACSLLFRELEKGARK